MYNGLVSTKINISVPAASALIIKNKKVLMLKRSNTVKLYKQYWQLPEGRVDLFENFEDAIIRELEEEIGYKPASVKFIRIHKIFTRFLFIPIPIYRKVFSVKPPKKIILSSEHDDYLWITPKMAIKTLDLVPGTKEMLKYTQTNLI